LTSTLTNDHIFIGNGSNISTATDTSTLGDILADHTNGMTLKAGALDSVTFTGTKNFSGAFNNEGTGQFGTDSTATANVNGDNLIVEASSGNVGISILSANNNAQTLYFGDVADPDSGFIQNDTSANKMFIGGGGSGTAMTIDSGKNVGIGTTSPSAPLTIANNTTQLRLTEGTDDARFAELFGQFTGAGDSAQLLLKATDSAGTSNTIMTLKGETQNVGIGTTGPGDILEVSGTTYEDGLTLTGNTTPTKEIEGSRSNPTEDIGAIAFYNGANRVALLQGNRGTTGDNYGRLTFRTANNGTMSPRMVIDEDGNVGIGETSPDTTFHVKSGATVGDATMTIEQLDIDQQFIDFVGTSNASGARSISPDTGETAAKGGAFQIRINGVAKWIRFYDDHN